MLSCRHRLRMVADQRPAASILRVATELAVAESSVRVLDDLHAAVGVGVVQGRYDACGHAERPSSATADSAPLITVSLRPGAAVAMFSAKKRATTMGSACPPL